MERPALLTVLIDLRGRALVEHARNVRGARRSHRQAEPQDAAGVEVLRDRQLDREPFSGRRLHRKYIQWCRVEHDVLARSCGAQPAEGADRPVGDRAALLRGPERVPALRQLLHPAIRRRPGGTRDHALAVRLGDTAVRPVDDHVNGGRRGKHELAEDGQTCFVPAGVHGGSLGGDAWIDKAGGASIGVRRHPAPQGPCADRHRRLEFFARAASRRAGFAKCHHGRHGLEPPFEVLSIAIGEVAQHNVGRRGRIRFGWVILDAEWCDVQEYLARRQGAHHPASLEHDRVRSELVHLDEFALEPQLRPGHDLHDSSTHRYLPQPNLCASVDESLEVDIKDAFPDETHNALAADGVNEAKLVDGHARPEGLGNMLDRCPIR